MKWDKTYIEELLHKYYEGETTVVEEAQLKEYFRETEVLPEGLKPHAAQFKYYAQQHEEQLNTNLSDDWLFSKIDVPQQEVEAAPATGIRQQQVAPTKAKQLFLPVLQAMPYWQVAAGILLLLGAFWIGSLYRAGGSGEAQNQEVAALRQELNEMKEILANGPGTGSSASERIQVVSQGLSEAPADDELINILIKTMNTDSNVNVRLAACEALYQYQDNQQVRSAFVKSLPLQKDPLMQLTLIDMLVGMKEKKAVDQLEKLVQQQDLLPIVKNKAEEGIGILI